MPKLTFFVVLFWGAFAAAEMPLMRVIAFSGNNPWEAMATKYQPTANGFYTTVHNEAMFHRDDQKCNDFLGKHQKRALEQMLENRYITRGLYDQLQIARAHDMRQYILVTLYKEMTIAEADRLGIPESRRMETFLSDSRVEMVRIHEGSLFAVRNYDIKRSGVNGFEIEKDNLYLPWEIGTLPATLEKRLDRTNIPAAVEFGRALVEGNSNEYFRLMMKAAVSAIAADLRTLGIDPATVPAMAHAYDPEHSRLFSAMFRGKPMTPGMQRGMENNPRRFFEELASNKKMKMPKKDEWARFDDAVIVNSMANMIEQYPVDSISQFAKDLREILPSSVTADQLQSLIQELVSSNREDFDYMGHDNKRPGHRKPIMLHDWGTPLFAISMRQAIQKVCPAATEQMMGRIIEKIQKGTLHIDPDFGQEDWFEKSIYVAIPPAQLQIKSNDPVPTMVVTNFDPDVSANEMPEYLGRILAGIAERIDSRLKNLNAQDRYFLLEQMNMNRARLGLPTVAFLSLPAFLETYTLGFASGNTVLKEKMKKLGAQAIPGTKMVFNFDGGLEKTPPHFDIKIDQYDLMRAGLDPTDVMKNQAKYKEQLEAIATKKAQILAQAWANENLKKHSMEIFTPAEIYRFQMREVEKQRNNLGPSAAYSLTPSYHREKLLRYFITYQ